MAGMDNESLMGAMLAAPAGVFGDQHLPSCEAGRDGVQRSACSEALLWVKTQRFGLSLLPREGGQGRGCGDRAGSTSRGHPQHEGTRHHPRPTPQPHV